MVRVGSDLVDHLVPLPCHRQGCLPLDQVAPSPVQGGLGHFQVWGISHLQAPPSPWDRRGCRNMHFCLFHGQSHLEFPRGPCQSCSMLIGFRPGLGETCVHARKGYEMGSAQIWTLLPGRFWVFALCSSPAATSQCP